MLDDFPMFMQVLVYKYNLNKDGFSFLRVLLIQQLVSYVLWLEALDKLSIWPTQTPAYVLTVQFESAFPVDICDDNRWENPTPNAGKFIWVVKSGFIAQVGLHELIVWRVLDLMILFKFF